MQVMRFFLLFFKNIQYKFLLTILAILAILSIAPATLTSLSESSRSLPLEIAQNTSTQRTSPSSNRSTTTLPSSANRPSPATPSRGTQASAAPTPTTGMDDLSNLKRPSLVTQAVLLSSMSLMPFVIMVLTSFLKIVVVLSLLRSALGVQQAPPNQVINGVAFLLSLFIMYPTATLMYDAAQVKMKEQSVPDSLLSPDSSTYVIEVASAASEPFKKFLLRNSSGKHQALFYRLAYRGLPEEYRETLKPDHFIVLVPSYITGQLKDAFEIGVLIYIPFFVIDLVTSNILLAMGMMMLSPVTISMPLKLFLLVMLDGWTILIEGLVKTFQ